MKATSSKRRYGPVIYKELAKTLATEIRDGCYKPGTKLPSIRTMARKLELCPSTVHRAYSALEREGMLLRFATYGYFVPGHSVCDPDDRSA